MWTLTYTPGHIRNATQLQRISLPKILSIAEEIHFGGSFDLSR